MKQDELLSDALIEQILSTLPRLKIGVLGDLFLDRYLDIDTSLTEPSLETGLEAYQVVRVRSYPGAAGTVINNLAALGVGEIHPISVIGTDGEGYELTEALARLPGVKCSMIFASAERRTPTYTKPMLQTPGQPAREWHRLDIKNRSPLPAELQQRILAAVDGVWPALDALVVLDQVSEEECGVITTAVRDHLPNLARVDPDTFILADSRERIHQFYNVAVKVNDRECRQALKATDLGGESLSSALAHWACGLRRAIFCTRGEAGIYLARPDEGTPCVEVVPAYPVIGPIDVVGAGDSTSAGITCAVAAGATLEQAAAFGNLIASITIQQIGVTGTASPEQVRQRWREIRG
jgi:rfaE bifunctional protein kinase chain/domain